MGRYLNENEVGSTLRWRDGTSGNNDERLADLIPVAEDRVDNICGRRFDLDAAASQRWFEIDYAALEDGIDIDDAPHDLISEVVVRGAHPDDPNGESHSFDASEWRSRPLTRYRSGQQWPADQIKLVRQRLNVLNWDYDAGIGFSPRAYGEYPFSSFPGQGNNVLGYLGVTARWGWLQVPTPVREASLLMLNRLMSRLDSPLGMTMGNDMYGVSYVRRYDPDIMDLLGPYRKLRML